MNALVSVSVPDSALADALAGVAGAEVFVWDMKSRAPRPHIDIVVPPYLGGHAHLAQLAGVTTKLVQSQSIGFDGVDGVLPAGTVFANAATVHETSTAELALGLIIAMQRGIPEAVRAMDQGHWNPHFRPSLADQRVLLVGYGGVSRAIERRLLPFELSITRVASTARDELGEHGQPVRVHGIAELPDLLRQHDIVVIGLPHNTTTERLFDAQMLSHMPDGALLVNVGRGAVVHTEALEAELRSGRLRAGLDVVDPEPLPAEHSLWGAPNLLITPHGGGDTSAMLPRMIALIERQIAHAAAGESFDNVVFS